MPCFGQVSVQQETFEKITTKNDFLGISWEILTEKLRFFSARFPLKIDKHWGRKISGSLSQNWISQYSTKGDPLGRQWVDNVVIRPPADSKGLPPPKLAGVQRGNFRHIMV